MREPPAPPPAAAHGQAHDAVVTSDAARSKACQRDQPYNIYEEIYTSPAFTTVMYALEHTYKKEVDSNDKLYRLLELNSSRILLIAATKAGLPAGAGVRAPSCG